MMCQKQECVIAFCFAFLYYTVAEKQLDMQHDAVDNRYIGCWNKRLEKVLKSGLLTEELNNSTNFQKAWNVGSKCSKKIPGGVEEHTVAMNAFAKGEKTFRKSFNNAVETMGGNASVYERHFPYKSLHFLLMDAMRLLNNGTCITVYSVSNEKYSVKNGSEVRFGRFTLVEFDFKDMVENPDLEKGTLFEISSCFVLNLKDIICNPPEDIEGLLSPAEVFKVDHIKPIKEDDYDYTKVVLKSTGKDFSSDNCFHNSQSPSTERHGSILLVFMILSQLVFFY